MAIVKIAKIVKRRGKWCVVSHKKDKNGKYRNMGCYSSKEEATKRLSQIYMFKHKKALLINVMTTTSDQLFDKGFIHLADVVNTCNEEFATGIAGEQTAFKLMKLANILEAKHEFQLAETINGLMVEMLEKNEEIGE